MAYITNYAYNHLIEHIKIKDTPSFIDKAFFRKNIYDNDYLYHIFNQLDLERLFKDKVLSSNNKDNYWLVYKEVPDNIDREKYIYEKQGSVKYHNDDSCKSLNSGFKDFFIPEPIQRVKEDDKARHKKLVKHIRVWFLENNYTVDRYLNDDISDKLLTREFNKNFAPQFGLDKIVVSQSEKNQFKWYEEKKPSGSQYLSNACFDYDKFIIDMSDLLKKRYDLCTGYAWESISKHDYLSEKPYEEMINILFKKQEENKLGQVKREFITNIGKVRIKNFLVKHRELKKKAVENLSDYFKWSYNFKQDSFSHVFLEDFNLEPCMMCHNKVFELQ